MAETNGNGSVGRFERMEAKLDQVVNDVGVLKTDMAVIRAQQVERDKAADKDTARVRTWVPWAWAVLSGLFMVLIATGVIGTR